MGVLDEGFDLDFAPLLSKLWVNPQEVVDGFDGPDPGDFIDDVHGASFVPGREDLTAAPHGTHVLGLKDGHTLVEVVPVLHPREEPKCGLVTGLEAR